MHGAIPLVLALALVPGGTVFWENHPTPTPAGCALPTDALVACFPLAADEGSALVRAPGHGRWLVLDAQARPLAEGAFEDEALVVLPDGAARLVVLRVSASPLPASS